MATPPTGKLRLKIPWKNLYRDKVIVEVEGVYAVAGPASGTPEEEVGRPHLVSQAFHVEQSAVTLATAMVCLDHLLLNLDTLYL